ncbi:MAG: serine aminopeptidase domain-containing protein [bacterium]
MSASGDSPMKPVSLPRRLFLGLYVAPTPEGLIIQGLDPDAPIASTVLQPMDRLMAVNGKRITEAVDLFIWQKDLKPGEEVHLQVERQGRQISVSFFPSSAALEEPEEGNVNEYGEFSNHKIRLRSLFTYPSGKDGRKNQSLPGILILPGLGGVPCDQPNLVHLVRDLAQTLAREGALVMRYDQRGVGDSEGEMYAEVDFLTEVADAGMALEALAHHPRCHPRDLRLIGLGLGGVMIPLVAAGKPRVKRVCLWGSLARSWISYALDNFLVQARMRRTPKEQIIPLQNLCCLLWGLLAATDMTGEDLLQSFPALKDFGLTGKYFNAKIISFWRQLARTNIEAAYEKCAFRILALRGEHDALSNQQDIHSILKAAKEAGLRVKGLTIPGIDHFGSAGNSMMDCYTRLLQGRIVYQPDRLLKPMAEWLLETSIHSHV